MSRPYVTTPTGVQTSIPYEIGVAAGLVPGHTRIAGLGFNPSVTTSGNQDIWSGGGLYPFQTTAQTLEIVSASANDTAAGTGARTVSMILLDANFNPVSVTVTLNGTTPVTISDGPYIRVNLMQVATAGSGQTNAGNITLRVAGAGATQGVILAGATIAQSSIFTVPAGFTMFVTKFVYNIVDNAATANYVTIATVINQQPTGNPAALLATQRFVITQQAQVPFELSAPFPIIVAEKQDLILRKTAINTTLPITAMWQGVICNNKVLL